MREAVLLALKTAAAYGGNPLVYIGGSTFVVSEAVPCFAKKAFPQAHTCLIGQERHLSEVSPAVTLAVERYLKLYAYET